MMIILGLLSILKILWTVIWIILAIMIIICLSSIIVHVQYWDGEIFWNVRYFGIKLLPSKSKRKKKTVSDSNSNSNAKPKNKHSPEPETETELEKPPKKLILDKFSERMQKLVNRLDMAESGMHALPETMVYLGKAMTWDSIETDILIAAEDAAACAEEYGLMQIILQNLFSQTGIWVHVKRKNIQLKYDFIEDKSKYNFRCKVKINIGKFIFALFVFLWYYLKDSHEAGQSVIRKKL